MRPRAGFLTPKEQDGPEHGHPSAGYDQSTVTHHLLAPHEKVKSDRILFGKDNRYGRHQACRRSRSGCRQDNAVRGERVTPGYGYGWRDGELRSVIS